MGYEEVYDVGRGWDPKPDHLEVSKQKHVKAFLIKYYYYYFWLC